MPATGQQRAIAAGAATLLFVTVAVIAPFASIQLGRVDAFVPVLQTALSMADLITAAILFAQYSIQPQRAPGQGSSLEIPFIEMPGTSSITSAKA